MFYDRRDAGEQLAAVLERTHDPSSLVLGIPRGGVVVADVVARALRALLDVIVVRKLGAPGNPELAIGAVGPDGTIARDERVITALRGAPNGYIEREAERQRAEIARRVVQYRGDRAPLDVRGQRCILVDDGIATGSTARAAILWLRAHAAARITLAVPVAPGIAVRQLAQETDEFACLYAPHEFFAVGEFYRSFEQVSDQEVVALLNRAPAA